MKKSIAKGILITNILLIITLLLSFFINRYFLLLIGIKQLGLIKLFSQILVYFSLAELGLGTASTYALYKPLAEKNYQKVEEILYTMKKMYNYVIYFVLISGLLFVFCLPYIIKDYTISYNVILYWLLYVINTAISYMGTKYIVLYTASQNYNFVRLVQGLSKILALLLQLLSIFVYKSILLFVVLEIFKTIPNIIIFRIYYNKKYAGIINFNNKYKIDKSILLNIKKLFWHKLAYILGYNTDLIIISSFISLKTVAIYASYISVFNIWTKLVSLSSNIVNPYIGKFIALNDKEKIYKKFKEINIIYLWISLLLFTTTYILIQSFMELWIKNKFNSKITVLFLCFNYGFILYRKCLDMFKNNSGFFDDIHLPMLEGGLNIILSLILVNYIGILGVIIGTLISNILIALIWKPILVYKVCFDKSMIIYIKDYLKYLVYLVITIILNYIIFITIEIKVENLKEFIKYGFIVFLIVLVVNSFVFMLDKDFRKQIMRRFL